jgi:hypothetical protein
MFEETVGFWIREMLQEGKLHGCDQDFLKQLTKEYAHQLEEFFYREVTLFLEQSGKAREFERMMLYDSQYINKYLNQTIPGYSGFQADIFNKAKKIIFNI